MGETNGIRIRGYKPTTIPSPLPHLGFEHLTQTLVKEAGEVLLTGIDISLSERIPEEYEKLPIYFRVSSGQKTVAKTMARWPSYPGAEQHGRVDDALEAKADAAELE